MDTINYKRLKEFFSKYIVETLKVDKHWKSYITTCQNRENGSIEYISVDWYFGYELLQVLKNNDIKKKLARVIKIKAYEI